MDTQSLALSLHGVARRYPLRFGLARVTVLDGLDLELARGRTLGLAGPNGSGKSTLLRLLAGIERADAGTLRVLGDDPTQPHVRARIGYASEDSLFPPELSLRSALRLLGELQGLRGKELHARCEHWLERVGLHERARTTLARCSRGMLRRFGLAQASLHAPDLLLLDEPTAGLDAPGFDVLDGVLAEARARGATVVLASHLASDLSTACDELAVLWNGRIARRGPGAELLGAGGLLELYRECARA